jgi:hypothetical protein
MELGFDEHPTRRPVTIHCQIRDPLVGDKRITAAGSSSVPNGI